MQHRATVRGGGGVGRIGVQWVPVARQLRELDGRVGSDLDVERRFPQPGVLSWRTPVTSLSWPRLNAARNTSASFRSFSCVIRSCPVRVLRRIRRRRA